MQRTSVYFLMLMMLTACQEDGAGTNVPNACDDGLADPSAGAVVATIADNYSVGALATVSTTTHAVHDSIVPLSGDAVWQHLGDQLALLDRASGRHSVSLYAPGHWSTPCLQFAMPDANPQAVALCDDKLFVAPYERDYLSVHDPTTGTLLTTVDLSAYADADGLPELAALVVANGQLYASAQHLDRNNYWTRLNTGSVLEIDCTNYQITNSWEVGQNPHLWKNPMDESELLVSTAGSEGGLWALDPDNASAPLQPLLANSTPGFDQIYGVSTTAQGQALVLAMDAAWNDAAWCADLTTGEVSSAWETDLYLAGVATSPADQAWLSVRPRVAQPDSEGGMVTDSEGGIVIYDLATCTNLTGEDWIVTELAPSNIVFYQD